MKKLISMVSLILLVAGCANTDSSRAASQSQPAVSSSTVRQALADTGLTIAGPLKAPEGYHGFVGVFKGRKLPIYVMPDGKHIVIGSMYDLDGHDLTSPAMRQAADASFGEAQWKALGKATWFSNGNADAGRVVYAFMDTECPYCHQLWEASQPWIQGGKVDFRIIPVAVISPKSLPYGAAVLAADDPSQAWQENEKHFGEQGASPDGKPSTAAIKKLRANNQLMMKLGFYGTPGVVYKDSDGHIHTLRGMPRTSEQLKAIYED